MARKKGGGGGDEGGSWMDTYGDLVTLLLTFFVLLYSMSSLDQSKWELFVKSIYPGMEDADGEATEKVILNANASSANSSSSGVLGDSVEMNDVSELDVNQLYITLAKQMDSQGVEGASVSRGTDYTFVEFKDNVFFEGDSSTISREGQRALDVFCDALAPYANQISQIDIMGHTASAAGENNIRSDRMLAAMRAAEVCIYIQNKNFIDPGELVSMEYGMFRPVTSNDTEEGRIANRRVQILLIDKGAEARNPDDYMEEQNSGANADKTLSTDGNPSTDVTLGQDAAATITN